MKLAFFLVLAMLLFQGCASVSMLPDDVRNVDFNSPEGKTGWSKYEHVESFKGYSPEQIYQSAKVGLGEAGFSLRVADITKGLVIGEHGITAHDWNVIAGVYFKETESGTDVKVIAQGSKDYGFSGDVTSDGWTGKILKGMREYLNETYQVVLKVDKSDIKSPVNSSSYLAQATSVWYSGGTLYNAKMKEWSNASYSNRLATTSDLLIRLIKADGKTVPSMDELKPIAIRFEREISDANKGGVANSQDVVSIAAVVWVLMN